MTSNTQTRDRGSRGLSGAVVSAMAWACGEHSESGVALKLPGVSMRREPGGGGSLARTYALSAV